MNGAAMPVFAAVENGNYSAVEILLRNGADPNKKAVVPANTLRGWERIRPLEIANRNKDTEIAALLVKYGGHE